MKAKADGKTTTGNASSAAKRRYSKLNAKERQMNEDYEWCLHDPVVRQQYSGQVVVAYRKRILGSGKNHMEAWRSAIRNRDCPGKDRVAVVAVPEAPPYSV